MVNFHLGEDRDMHDDNLACAPHRNAKPSDIITFGIYPRAADGMDRSPIKWRVLQNSGTDLFILSETLLDCKRYHSEFTDISWSNCDLRKWLNIEFYNTAFNVAEQEHINTTLCTDNGEGRPDTEDKVFLLSVGEVKSLTSRLDKDNFGIERRAIGTEFAKAKKADGCHLYVYDKSVESDYLTQNGEKHGCSWWWLRTQLGDSSRATFVGPRASTRSYGRVNLPYYGVRPALKLRASFSERK